MNLHYGGAPADWIAHGGRPARCLGKRGIPSYEHEDGRLLVYDLLVAQRASGGVMLFPRSYGFVAAVAPDGMVPLYLCPVDRDLGFTILDDQGHANAAVDNGEWWKWRPCVYRWTIEQWWQGLGSQSELAWRYGLAEVQRLRYDAFADAMTDATIQRAAAGEDFDADAIADAAYEQIAGDFGMAEACERADRLLRENLSYQQRIEHLATGNFRVRGARTGNVYRVTVGDGFELLDGTDDEILCRYCLHVEEWMPEGDQALAVKFALEDRELEVEVLEGARCYPRDPVRRVTMSDRIASRLERKHALL